MKTMHLVPTNNKRILISIRTQPNRRIPKLLFGAYNNENTSPKHLSEATLSKQRTVISPSGILMIPEATFNNDISRSIFINEYRKILHRKNTIINTK